MSKYIANNYLFVFESTLILSGEIKPESYIRRTSNDALMCHFAKEQEDEKSL